jgi:hypothetical protein
VSRISISGKSGSAGFSASGRRDTGSIARCGERVSAWRRRGKAVALTRERGGEGEMPITSCARDRVWVVLRIVALSLRHGNRIPLVRGFWGVGGRVLEVGEPLHPVGEGTSPAMSILPKDQFPYLTHFGCEKRDGNGRDRREGEESQNLPCGRVGPSVVAICVCPKKYFTHFTQ